MSWLETRKIIRVGEKSYAITIPKKWASILGLEPGSTVDVIFDKTGIIYIKPRKLKAKAGIPSEVVLKLNECDSIVDKCISGCYIEGHDIVVLEVPPTMEVLDNISSKLPGVIVVEGEGDKVIVKMAISENIVRFDEVINRMVKVLESMYDHMEEFIEEGSKEDAYKLLKSDDELDRLFFLGLRLAKRSILSKLLEGDISYAKELLDITLLIRSIEHVGDALDRSVRILLDIDYTPLKNNLLELFRLSRKIILDAIFSCVRINLKMASKVLERRREFKKKIASLRGEVSLTIQGVLSELDLIATIAEDIIDIAVSRYVRFLEKKKRP